jgi:phosphopantothenoylcysteine decarboxylase/phosphopantothenate--cysteine ligase
MDPSSTEEQPGAVVILGIGGGIAAYKACELLRRLTESGYDVHVIPTAAALRFVGEASWAALSGHPVSDEVWANVHEVPHVRLGQTADLVVVAPATADLLAKAAHGLADDLLTNTLLTARCPLLYAPTMHTEMWEHPATRDNVATLRDRGAIVLEPAVGRLAGGDAGPGRLPEPDEIFAAAHDLLARGSVRPDLVGRRVVVTAGGTREYLDPVRFLANRSSGRQGYALARAALIRGAEVTLVSANASIPDPAGIKVLHVETTVQLQEAVNGVTTDADALVMAAAPADFRPRSPAEFKIKKPTDESAPVIELTQNPDILKAISQQRPNGHIVVVGFAAETGDDAGGVLDHGREKLARKGCDLLVVNDVSGGAVFGADSNAAVVLGADGSATDVPLGSKDALSHTVWDLVAARWPT